MGIENFFAVTNHFLIFICETEKSRKDYVEEAIKKLKTNRPSSELSPGLWRITIRDNKPIYMSEIVKKLSNNGEYRLLILRITDETGLNWCLNTSGSEELTKIIENPDI